MLGILLLAIVEFFSRLRLILMLKAYNQVYSLYNFFFAFLLVHYCRCSGANGPQLSSSKLEAGRIRPACVLALQGFGHHQKCTPSFQHHLNCSLLQSLKMQVKEYPGPVDDMIVFALSATLNNNQIFVDNTHYYGVSMAIFLQYFSGDVSGDYVAPGGRSSLVSRLAKPAEHLA